VSKPREWLKACVQPVRKALGINAILGRLDELEARLLGQSSGTQDGAPFVFVTFRLDDGRTYDLAFDRFRRDEYHQQVAAGHVHDHTWRLVTRWVRSGDVFFDLGANIGTMSIPVAVRGATVHAFELLQENATLLAEAAQRNRLENISIVIGAVWNESTCLPIAGHSAWGNVVSSSRTWSAAISLDDYVVKRHIGRVDFLKIDVEGAEKQAILGARRLLERHRPDIVFESNVLTCGQVGYSHRELTALLTGFGYRVYRLLGTRLCPVDVTTTQEVVLADYLATNKSHDEIRARSGMTVESMAADHLIESILSQQIENDYHKACVVAGRDRLPATVAGDPRVHALLAQWEPLRSKPFFETLQLGLR
jgi:FkbM family methyltransferase